jgi:hypothetical protein
MNDQFFVLLAAAVGTGIVVAGWTPTRPSAPRLWPGVIGLGGLIAALLAVGVVSGTLTRHLIQVAPATLALILVASGSAYGRAAALPILTLWTVLMGTIWLFLLGLASIIQGRFTPIEIALTVAIAAACLTGLTGGARPTANLSRTRRAATATASGLFQLAAFWASMQPWANVR